MVKTLQHGDGVVIRAGKKTIHILVFDEVTIVLGNCEVDENED